MAAPVGGQVLAEVLPYLDLQKDNTEQVEEKQKLTMPEIRNKTIKEAEKELKELGLELQINDVEDASQIKKEEVYIKEQLPKPGITITSGTKVYVEI